MAIQDGLPFLPEQARRQGKARQVHARNAAIDTLFPPVVGPNFPPVPYPGGKTRLRSVLRRYVGKPDRLVSPFLGGGSVEVDAVCRSVPVLAADIDGQLVQFWQQVLTDSQAIAEAAQDFWPQGSFDITADNFYSVAGRYEATDDPALKAALFLYGKCFSFGARGMHSGWKGLRKADHPDTRDLNRSAIERLLDGYHLPGMEVKQQDWQTTLAEVRTGDLVFLDPPYPGNENLYNVDDFGWCAFYDAVDALPVPWVMTLTLDDLASERLRPYTQRHLDYYSQLNMQSYTETIITHTPAT